MSENVNDDKGYQVFSNLMDAVFELCEELNGFDPDDLSDAEIGLLDAMDKYVAHELEENENEQ